MTIARGWAAHEQRQRVREDRDRQKNVAETPGNGRCNNSPEEVRTAADDLERNNHPGPEEVISASVAVMLLSPVPAVSFAGPGNVKFGSERASIVVARAD